MLLAKELPQVAVPDQFLPSDPNAARVNIEKAAYHGFAKAQVKMGAAYELCQLGCDFNPALSLHYNALAARQGEPDAEMAISKWFLCGHEGVFEKNDEMAFTYAKRAAQNGLATAEFALGYFYEIGISVPVDIKEARSWYAKAAANGNKDASGRIDSISRSKTLSRKDHEKVAIARIRSQYASHGRGRQPHAETQKLEPVQDTLEMPDPSKMSISSHDPMDTRPMSAAPYPDSANPRFGRPGGGQFGPEMRSSSAFGINPNLRSQSTAQAPPGPVRSTSGFTPGYPPQQGAGMPMPPGPNYGGSQGPPKLDIGFSAPHDPSGADRRNRLQRPGTFTPQSHPGTPMSGPDPRQNRIPSAPTPSAGRVPGHGSPAPGARPPRGDSRPSKPSAPESAASTPAAKPSPGGLPGKGPKTFEEMGVPQVKSNGDCVRNPYLPVFTQEFITILTISTRLLCDSHFPLHQESVRRYFRDSKEAVDKRSISLFYFPCPSTYSLPPSIRKKGLIPPTYAASSPHYPHFDRSDQRHAHLRFFSSLSYSCYFILSRVAN